MTHRRSSANPAIFKVMAIGIVGFCAFSVFRAVVLPARSETLLITNPNHDPLVVGDWLRTKGHYAMTLTLNADGTGQTSEGLPLLGRTVSGTLTWDTKDGKMRLWKTGESTPIALIDGNTEKYACDGVSLTIGPSTFHK